MDLAGRSVIVTGGARGLGRVTVSALLARGARITVFDADREALDALSTAGEGVTGMLCDVSDYEQVRTATEAHRERFGVPDVLVNNAGILRSAPLVRLTETGPEGHDVEEWRRVLAANLDSVFFMTLSVVLQMVATRRRGVIVNISSVAAAGNAGQTAYSAAKAGVNALTATWAKELGPLGIRVVAIAPGFMETPSMRAAVSEPLVREVERRTPLRRLGRPEEVAAAVVAAIENDFFHGKVLPIDGGLIV
jgi:3-oxoacyl-[acyl-carrier protein] reductase